MKKGKENNDFIEINIGEISIELPNDYLSVEITKKYIDALYTSFPKPSIECVEQEIEVKPIGIKLPKMQKEIVEDIKPKKLPIIEEQKEIKVDSKIESYDACPLCNSKLKKKKIKQVGSEIRQKVLCKNKKCKFERDYIFSI